MLVVSAQTLTSLGTAIFAAIGAPPDIARVVTESLVLTNLLGHDSHGVMRVMTYVDKVRKGTLQPANRPTVESRSGAIAQVDCGWGFGQISARFGVEVARDIAREFGIGCVALKRVNHIGRLGEYAGMLAAEGLIGIVLTSGAMFGGSVAPYGGRERVFGTNPLAMAVPVKGGRSPLIADFATSGISVGKLLVALSKEESLSPGLLLDADGSPTTDPANFNTGGMLLPFGGYKGYGLMLMIEIIPTLLAGFAPASSSEYQPGNPTLIIALRIESFTEIQRFHQLVDELLARVKDVTPQGGFEEVLLPGELEARAYAVRSKDGIPIPDVTWQQLIDLADELGIRE